MDEGIYVNTHTHSSKVKLFRRFLRDVFLPTLTPLLHCLPHPIAMFFCFSLFSFSCEIISPHALLFYTSPWPGRMYWEGSITKWRVLALSHTVEKPLGNTGLCTSLAFNLCCALLRDLRVCYCSVAHLILTSFQFPLLLMLHYKSIHHIVLSTSSVPTHSLT